MSDEKFTSAELAAANTWFTRPCDFMLSVAQLPQLPEADKDEIAFAGRSNVGKSSLINALFNQKKLAKTSSTPGRTQQLNFFNFAGKIYLVDLPGYGYAQAPEKLVKQWQAMLKAYLRGRPNLRRVFLLIDARHGLKKEDLEIMQMLDEAAVAYQIVLTKVDKISAAAAQKMQLQILESLKTHAAAMNDILLTSAEKKIGLDQCRAEICSLFNE